MPSSSHAVPAPYRLLVVDREHAILDLLRDVLAEEGAESTLVDNLPSALATLERERFDVILTDTLDRRTADAALDHWTTLEALKARARATPVLICSAHPASTFAGMQERGFAGFIAKPFDIDALAQIVRCCVNAEAQRRAPRALAAPLASR